MTNQERLDKLKQAQDLIRDVEFSYPIDHPIRNIIYRMVVSTFSFLGCLDCVLSQLKSEIVKESTTDFTNDQEIDNQ